MSTGDRTDGEEPDIAVRCLKLCREVIWNANDPDAPYTLRGVFHRIRPRAGYPSALDRSVSVHVEYDAGVGAYDVWLELVRLELDEEGEVADEVEETSFGPFVLTIDVERFVHGRMYVLRKFPLAGPGLYELRLRVSGVDSPLVTERLFAEELP
jgi:hypothetical protein